MSPRRVLLPLVLLFCAFSCQDYPFEQRLPQRVVGTKVTQQVAQVTPTDILFIIDNSGSMLDERHELMNNVSLFIQQLSQSDNDFHVGVVTTDVECNIPERDCGPAGNNGPTSLSCCAIVNNAGLGPCQELDTNGDGKIDFSTCDGGRLRSIQGLPAYFTRPAADPNSQAVWAQNLSTVINNLGCQGSGLESGLEAARRAISCSVGDANCTSSHIAQLNAGFIRAEADLVLIFVTDEDDCSFLDSTVYERPYNAADPNAQAGHLCAPIECYAYYGKNLDTNHDGLQDWADPNTSAYGIPLMQCEGNNRGANPPYPSDISNYLNYFIAAKGGNVNKVRAAGIVSATTQAGAPLGMYGDACTGGPLGVTNNCGCWSASAVIPNPQRPNFYCTLTATLGRNIAAVPSHNTANECSSVGSGGASNAPQPGCDSMPGTRYVNFLQSLSTARQSAGGRSDTLLDTICNQSYESTMYSIVNTIILTSCFGLTTTPASAADINVTLNGNALVNVSVGSSQPGWSFTAGTQQVCLEGGLRKKLGDQFDIFIVESQSAY